MHSAMVLQERRLNFLVRNATWAGMCLWVPLGRVFSERARPGSLPGDSSPGVSLRAQRGGQVTGPRTWVFPGQPLGTAPTHTGRAQPAQGTVSHRHVETSGFLAEMAAQPLRGEEGWSWACAVVGPPAVPSAEPGKRGACPALILPRRSLHANPVERLP